MKKLQERYPISSRNQCQFLASTSSRLERAAYGKSEAATLARKKYTRKLLRHAQLRIWIVEIYQPKRNVHDRDLNSKFDTDARFEIADLAECRLVNAKQRILLDLAPKIGIRYSKFPRICVSPPINR